MNIVMCSEYGFLIVIIFTIPLCMRCVCVFLPARASAVCVCMRCVCVFWLLTFIFLLNVGCLMTRRPHRSYHWLPDSDEGGPAGRSFVGRAEMPSTLDASCCKRGDTEEQDPVITQRLALVEATVVVRALDLV